MRALIVIDAQNEFSPAGQRPVPNHEQALAAIHRRIDEARREGRPIAFIRHHNNPHESAAFQPGSWGAEFSTGIGPRLDRPGEAEFVKDVFGAFTGTGLGSWLEQVGCDDVLLVGFYTHMCVSTTAREAIMRGLSVKVDPDGTGAAPLRNELLGEQSADEVKRTALLQLTHMGAVLPARPDSPSAA